MEIVYIFPHPDDESFGPASLMHAQACLGHNVHLLTLTQGGATKVRIPLGLSVAEMGELRMAEMQNVKKVLGLKSLTIWDMPDSGLTDMDQDELTSCIMDFLQMLKPEIVVTYANHGISGFPDHLVSHSVVKEAFETLKGKGASYLRRLAFFTVSQKQLDVLGVTKFKLSTTPDEGIMVEIPVDERNAAAMNAALDCYVSYLDVIEQTGVRRLAPTSVCFELWNEHFSPPLTDICAELP